MRRASWIVAAVFFALFVGEVQAIPVSDTQDFTHDTTTQFNLGVGIPSTNIMDVQLDLVGVIGGPGFLGSYALGVDWELDGVPLGTTPFSTSVFGPDPFSDSFTTSDPAILAVFADGVADLTGTGFGGVVFGFPVGPTGTISGFSAVDPSFGATLTVNTINPIPEPGTVFLFLFGVVGAGAAARKKARAAAAE